MDQGRPVTTHDEDSIVSPPRDEGSMSADGESAASRPVYRLFGREFKKPGSRRARIALGVALSVAGLFGFLPVLGFWMIPLGLLILSHEYHLLRRIRRRWAVRAGRRRNAKTARTNGNSPDKSQAPD